MVVIAFMRFDNVGNGKIRNRIRVVPVYVTSPLTPTLHCTVFSAFLLRSQCDQIWHNFCNFVGNIKVFGNFFSIYLIFGRILSQLLPTFYAIGQIFIDVSGPILTRQSGHADGRHRGVDLIFN